MWASRGGLKNIAMNLGRHAVRKAVEGNHIRAFGKHGDAIDYELKTFSPLIGHAAQFDGAQSGLGLGVSRKLATGADLRRKSVPVLSAVTDRIPQFRRGDPKRN